MDWFWELSNDRVVAAAGVYTAAELEKKRGDSGPDNLIFLQKGIVVEGPEGFDLAASVIHFGGKLPGSPDYLTESTGFVKTGAGTATKWAWRSNWNTDPINDALNIGDLPEKSSIAVELEFEIVDATDPDVPLVRSTNTVKATIDRDINRGDEGVPTLPGPYVVLALLSDDLPLANGIASAGTSDEVSRADHTHPASADFTSLANRVDDIEDDYGVAGGLATLDGSGHLPASMLPIDAMEFKGTWNASTNSPALADGTGDTGDVYRVSTGGTRNLGSGSITWVSGDQALYNGTIWQRSSRSDAVATVAGRTGDVVLVKGDVGLANVDNTSDANKPVSTLQQTALNLKADIAAAAFTTVAPTSAVAPAAADSSTKIPTSAWVQGELAAYAKVRMTIKTVSTTTYAPVATDAVNTILYFTNAAGCTVTWNTGIFSAGDFVPMRQRAAGQVTSAAGSGMTQNAEGALVKTKAQHATMFVFFDSGTEYTLEGNRA